MDGFQLSEGYRAIIQGHSLLITIQFPGVSGTQLMMLKGWKAELTLELPSDFEPRTLGLGIQHLNH